MRKILRVSKSTAKAKLELLDIHLNTPFILIGRSPLCDEVLRAPGIQPVHFLLEWVGEGEFNPSEGLWTLFDVSQNQLKSEAKASAEASAEGVTLLEPAQQIGGYTWAWAEDRMAKVHLEKGVLKESLAGSFAQLASTEKLGYATEKLGYALEVVRISREEQIVTDIVHHFETSKTIQKIERIPEIKINWQLGSQMDILFKVPPENIISIKGISLPCGNFKMSLGEVYRVFLPRTEFYLRIVQKIPLPAIPHEILKDPFYRLLAGGLVFAAVMLLFFKFFSSQVVIEDKAPEPRVVTIQEVEVKPLVKTEEAEPAPKPEPAKPEPVVITSPPPKAATNKKTPPQESAVAAPTFKTKPGVEKKGLNSPAPVTDVNSVGLLGKLKSKSSSEGAAKLSADAISNTFVDDTASAKDGIGIVVKTATAGVVDINSLKKGEGSGNQSSLGQASTTLQGGKGFDPNSGGPIASAKGLRGQYALGNSAGKEASIHLGGQKDGMGIEAESVLGGLTKNQVSQAIAAHRREIRTCFESALVVRSNLHGVVTYHWTIAGDGTVISIKIKSSETGSNMLDSCVMQVIRKIEFPQAPNGQPTIVIYPFVFKKT